MVATINSVAATPHASGDKSDKEPHEPVSTWNLAFVKLVAASLNWTAEDVVMAVNLYQTSYVAGPVQVPSGAADSVAPAIVPEKLSHAALMGKLVALAQLSLNGGVTAG